MLNEQMLSCFVEVVKRESFSKAAEELFLSQQAVSKQVKKLEEELDCELLARSTRHIELTEIGREYYEVFLKWQMDYEEVKRKALRLSSEDMRLRIAMLSRMNSGKIPSIVHHLKGKNREYQLSVVHDSPLTLNEQLENDDCDLIITYEDFIDEHMAKEKKYERVLVGKTELLLCVSNDHPEIQDLEELDKDPFLVCVDKGVSKKEALEKSVADRKKFGLGNGTVKLFGSIEEVNMMTELGEGFCLCSSTNMFVKNAFIRTYPLPKVTKIYAVWKKKNHSKPLKEFLSDLGQFGPVDEIILPFGEQMI